MPDKGLDVNDVDNADLNSPLHAAVLSGNLKCVEILVQNGALKDLVNVDGQTALDVIDSEMEQGKQIGVVVEGARSTGKLQNVGRREIEDMHSNPRQEFAALSAEQKKRRIDKWAELKEDRLQKIAPYVPKEVFGLTQQMLELRQLLECQRALITLHNDDEFQEDIRKPWVLDAVEEISSKQDSIERYRDNGQVMGVMEKLRKLREVFLRNGGKRVKMDDLKYNGSNTEKEEDEKRLKILTQALAGTYQAIINKIENPENSLRKQKQQNEGQQANGSGQSWGEIIKYSLQNFLVMVAVGIGVMIVMWMQGMLPWQDAYIQKIVQKKMAEQTPQTIKLDQQEQMPHHMQQDQMYHRTEF
eukprot:TRINITY_DN13506_c0_g1_i3.p2 TRINITY_DN13506_c0_g1~~TRINITY_DN13506_c0_g1_i3.p2  ORF type:complete len:373 (+),score=79.85 TRINITY_DN13506_c0_g1_i3:46-1119(+)